MAEEFTNYVDGKWVGAASGATFPSVNPANKADVLGVFPRSDHRDVDRAAEAARGHFAEWHRVPAPGRAQVLRRIADLLRANQEGLATLVTREMGKILPEARAEVEEAAELVEYLAGEGGRLRGAAVPADRPDRFIMTLCVPVGVVAAITPWHAPLALPAGTVAAALVAGNTVVLKPAEDTPLMAIRLVELLLEAGLPPGVVSLVHGPGEDVGAPLVRHPDVALVAFTGSGAVGREVAIACAAEHKGVALALGGKNALLVMEDADLNLALASAVAGAFATAGQRQLAVSRIILHKKIAREFTERLVARAGSLRLGDGLLPASEMGPLVNEARLKRVHTYTRQGVKEGARLLCGGEPFREGDCKRGFFYLPTLFGEVRPAMRIAQEEILGPTACLLTVGDLEEGIAVANGPRHVPAAAIFTRDVQRAWLAVRELRAGRIAVNGWPPGEGATGVFAAAAPAGNGRPGGARPGVDAFTAWKAIAFDYSGTAPDPAR